MQPLTWENVKKGLEYWKPQCDAIIIDTGENIKQYPKMNDNPESLSQLLANLNFYVMRLGDIQPRLHQFTLWTEKRYAIEKGLETVRIIRDEKKAVNYAENAKYEKIQEFLDTMVNASALHMRVQNARSSARDTTEAIRSRISQIKGSIRSS